MHGVISLQESVEWATFLDKSFSHLGLTSDHLMVSEFHDGIHDPKRQAIVKSKIK